MTARQRKQYIEKLRKDIQNMNDRIARMDRWFIENISVTADWTARINEYWLTVQRCEDARIKLKRLRNGLQPLQNKGTTHHIVAAHRTLTQNPTNQ